LQSDRFAVCARAHFGHTGAYTWALGVPRLFINAAMLRIARPGARHLA